MKQSNAEQKESNLSGEKSCPNCTFLNNIDATQCSMCTNVFPKPFIYITNENNNQTNTWVCHKCGIRHKEIVLQCSCGAMHVKRLEMDEWKCNTCTFYNKNTDICKICNKPRKSDIKSVSEISEKKERILPSNDDHKEQKPMPIGHGKYINNQKQMKKKSITQNQRQLPAEHKPQSHSIISMNRIYRKHKTRIKSISDDDDKMDNNKINNNTDKMEIDNNNNNNNNDNKMDNNKINNNTDKMEIDNNNNNNNNDNKMDNNKI
eukprot:464904_1